MENDFRKFLKRGGRSDSVIKRVVAIVDEFNAFLAEKRGRDLQNADEEDLEAFVELIEGDSKTSAKGHLWGLVYYFAFTENEDLKSLASTLRGQRIERRPFPIRNFRGLDPEVVEKIEAAGIKHVKQALVAGTTPQARADLATHADVSEEAILEIVKLADLARIPGLKGVRARLYHDAGVDTLEKLAGWEPEPLQEMLTEFVAHSGFEGIAPLPAEIRHSISKAKQLPRIVEY